MRVNTYKNGRRQVKNRLLIRIVMLLALIGISATSGVMLHASAMNSEEAPIADTAAATAASAEENGAETGSIVCVEPGDTLWKIAKAYGPDDVSAKKYVQRIMEANGLESASLQVGQVLRLP